MNILLTINDLYVTQSLVLINSIFINNSEKINIHIIHCGDLNSKSIDRLNDFISARGGTLHIYYIDIEWLNGYFIGPWGKVVMLKLYAWKVLKNIDRVLYLDADTLVIGSLKELWDLELSDNYFAVFTETIESSFVPGIEFMNYYLKKGRNDFYINAGVLLLNLKELRKDNPEWEEYYKENFMRCLCPEEQLILFLWRHKIVPISLKWNYETTIFRDQVDIRILHYGIKKPWVTSGPYHDVYLKYCNLPECNEIYNKVLKNVKFFPMQFPILETWLMFEMNHSDYFQRFFNDRGYNNVAVYGIGRMSKLFTYKNNKVNAVNIKYYLDAYKDEKSFLGKKVIKPNYSAIKELNMQLVSEKKTCKEIDAVIVTPIDEFYEIDTILKEIYTPQIKVVSIVEIIFY